MASDTREMNLVQEWLQPLPDSEQPCGPDLEYDDAYLELMRIAQGKPETQFGPGEPPAWREVREQAEALFARTRDLRVALLWLRACVNLSGFSALSPGLQLVHGLLSNFPEQLHPLPDPDDGDQYARVNALAMLPAFEGLLGDLRECVLFRLRGSGELRLRAVAVAVGQMPAREDETALTREQVTLMIASAIEQQPEFQDQPREALADVQSLSKLLSATFGADAAPDLRPLADLVKNVVGLMPAAQAEGGAGEDDGQTSVSTGGGGSGGGGGGPRAALGNVMSREDALRAIDMVCEYLERTEPTNPAQLLLRRARRMINHNFLQLIKELAPEALNEAARVMGVDPQSINLDEAL